MKEGFKSLVKELTRLEGGKTEVNVAQMTEVLSRLKVLFKKYPLVVIRVLLK